MASNIDGRPRLVDDSFADFQQGTLGNAGHNLYVSRAGILQRITYTSLSGSGYVDIPFANSHDDATRVPAYLYTDPLNTDERVEIESDGAFAGAVADLNDDGYDDLVIANQYDGATNEVYGQVYFGSAEGFSRKRMLKIWAPSSKDVAIGRFAPGAKPSIVFVSRERLRVFDQDEAGFASALFFDLRVGHGIESAVVADLDGDGIDDLVVRAPDSTIRVYWGGDHGIDPARATQIDTSITGTRELEAGLDTAAMGSAANQEFYGPSGLFVYKPPTQPRITVVDIAGRPHLFLCPEATSVFLSFSGEREARVELEIESGPAMSAAAGDIRGRGCTDIVLATRQRNDGEEFSLVYWGEPDGSFSSTPQRIPSRSANDVAMVDLDGNGCGDILICQDQVPDFYTTESLIYAATPKGIQPNPRRLVTHCALDLLFVTSPFDGLPKPVFINHLTNTVRGNVDTYVYLGGPDGYSEDRRLTFRGWAATELKFIDFSDNGAPDVLVTNSNENYLDADNGSFIYYRGDEAGYPRDSRVELPTNHNMSAVVADLDRDGYLDLVACGWGNSELEIFYGSPDGFGVPVRLKLEIDGRVYDQPRFMSLADLNQDGYLDLVIPVLGRHCGLIILWGSPDGFSTDRATVIESGTTVSTRIADLDGDGWLDLIVGGFKGDNPRDDYRTSVYIYWGGPDGYANDRRTQLPAYFPADVAVADLNNDDILDIVATNYNGHLHRDLDSYIYWGAPGGDYHPTRVTRLFHHSACGILAADFNEDGYVDLAIANHKTYGNHPGHSYVWYNGPDGFAESRRVALPTAGPHGLSHLDIGNVYDRGPEEYFESRVFTTESLGTLRSIRWQGTVPAKTWVRAQVRTAETPEGLNTAPWVGPSGSDTWVEADTQVALPVHRFVQYRLALGATNSVATPRVTSVELAIT